MSDKREEKKLEGNPPENGEIYALDDERRVKVLSPGAMVAKRFFRNRIAVVGLAILAFMFLFSFLGGVLNPYRQDQLFYTTTYQKKDFAGAVKNEETRFMAAEGQKFDSIIQAQAVLGITTHKDVVTYKDVNYHINLEGADFYSVSLDDGTVIGIAYKDVVSASTAGASLDFSFVYNVLKAYCNEQSTFSLDGREYTISEGGLVESGEEEVAFISRYIVSAIMPGS